MVGQNPTGFPALQDWIENSCLKPATAPPAGHLVKRTVNIVTVKTSPAIKHDESPLNYHNFIKNQKSNTEQRQKESGSKLKMCENNEIGTMT